MKNNLLLLAAILPGFFSLAQNSKATNVKEVPRICDGLPAADKPMVAVMPFKLSTREISEDVSSGFADVLVNAIFNTGCFRIVERDRLREIMAEEGLGQTGAGDEASFASVGKLMGAQLMVFGTITEFKENAGERNIVAGALKRLGAGGVAIGRITSHLSYTLKFVDPTTGELLDSKSFSKTKTSTKLATGIFGASNSGIAGGGSGFYKSKSMEEAIEESLIEAIQFMSQNKSAYATIKSGVSGAHETQKYNATTCPMLASGHAPRIMVLIPEFHITQRIPDPAAETEINRRFIEAGFQVVDPALFASINNSVDFKDAIDDPARAISYGKKFGADIVIYGEAFSERPGTVNSNDAGTINGLASCRARVEVRAVRTDNAQVMASNGMEAGAADNSEFVAAKAALRKAGSLVATYLLEQFCSKPSTFGGKSEKPVSSKPFTEIIVLQADYATLRSLAALLSAKGKVVDKSLKNAQGYIKLEHAGTSESIADFIDAKAGKEISIQNVETGNITLSKK